MPATTTPPEAHSVAAEAVVSPAAQPDPILLPVRFVREFLAIARFIQSARCTLPVLGCIRISRQAGVCTLTANNLDLAISGHYGIPDPLPNSDLGRRLYDSRRARNDFTTLVEFTAFSRAARASNANFDMEILPGTIRYPIGVQYVSMQTSGLDPTEFQEPARPADEAPLLTVPKSVLLRLAQSADVASDDKTRYVLQGVHIAPDPEHHTAHLVATDGRRLVATEVPRFAALPPIIIPTTAARALCTMFGRPFCPDGAIRVDHISDTARFEIRGGPFTLTGRGIDGNFPNWRQAVPATHKGTIFFSKQTAAEILSYIRSIGTPDSLLLKPDAKNQVVSIGTPEKAIHLHARIDGKPCAIRFSAEFLKHPLSHEFFELRLIDPISPGVFHHADGARYVLMPMR